MEHKNLHFSALLSFLFNVTLNYHDLHMFYENFDFLMLRASKQRRKADRIVLECQEQACWLVNRPPVSNEQSSFNTSKKVTKSGIHNSFSLLSAIE